MLWLQAIHFQNPLEMIQKSREEEAVTEQSHTSNLAEEDKTPRAENPLIEKDIIISNNDKGRICMD